MKPQHESVNDKSAKEHKHCSEDNDEERLEWEHFQKIVRAFLAYKFCSLQKLEKRVKDFTKIPLWHRKMIPGYAAKLKECKTGIDQNQMLIQAIVNFSDGMFQNADFGHEAGGISQKDFQHISPEDQSKVITTLTQIVRDWADEGIEERKGAYGPILDAIKKYFPEDQRSNSDVLVPGAGLGRLVFEITKLGFNCQGNEFSLYMLFASNFILNAVSGKNTITFYPWVHQFCNMVNAKDQIAPVTFPDTDPRELPSDAKFSMAAGDFLEVYTVSNYWDCIATSFFIDTAHNIIAYVEKIYAILKPGGLWINNGPLLYHFADVPGEISIELSYEELRQVILQDFKFELVEEEIGGKSSYIQNPRSMLKMTYDCIFFVMRKPKE